MSRRLACLLLALLTGCAEERPNFQLPPLPDLAHFDPPVGATVIV